MAQRYYVPGPCSISWGGLDLGFTKAGINIVPQTSLIPIVDDEHGTEPADWIRAGKSATVECVLNDMAKILAAQPYIGLLLSNVDGSADTQVGKLVNDGSGSTTNILGKELIITERDNANLWKAKFTAPSDPAQIMLASTQENLMPITFVVALDDDDNLFYTLPSYLV